MNQNSKPLVYSYTRFSSAEQAKGDSERRQTEAIRAAERFAAEKGLKLDDRLRMVDKGLSGFHGKHREKGAFGKFLEKVKTGEVPPGSILLVENLDRLSREPYLTAMETVIGLLKHGITIQTLNPPDSYTTDSVNNNGFWRLVAHIDRAHAESKRKSDLAQANWKQKRKMASKDNLLTSRLPAWFKVTINKVNDRVVSREVVVNEAAKQTIQLIFKMKLEGFGKTAIEKKLNATAAWIPPGRKGKSAGWRSSYIQKILRNRAVIGEYQPHRLENGKRVSEGEPIANYFEPIVAPDVFYAVQKQIKANARTGGRTGMGKNVLKNLCRCGYCGGAYVLIDKGSGSKGGKYLMCDDGRRGVRCASNPVRYDEVKQTVLENCSKLRPELILPDCNQQAKEAKQLRTRLSASAAEIAAVDDQIGNLIDQISRTAIPSLRTRYEQKYQQLEGKKAELIAAHEQTQATLQSMERGRGSFEQWQKNLAGLREAIKEDADSRIRLNAHLKEFISGIEIFAKGHQSEAERAEDIIFEQVPELAKAPSFKSFRKYLSSRLLSPDGRFFRVHFKVPTREAKRQAGKYATNDLWHATRPHPGLQIAPADSLAYRNEVSSKERKHFAPALGRLYSEFFDRRKRGFVAKPAKV